MNFSYLIRLLPKKPPGNHRFNQEETQLVSLADAAAATPTPLRKLRPGVCYGCRLYVLKKKVKAP